MPLPTNIESRKKIAQAVVKMLKLSPERRKAVLDKAKARRQGLSAPTREDFFAPRDSSVDTAKD